MGVVISAADFEVSALKALCGNKFRYLSCGIGSLQAAKREAGLVELCEGKDVIFVGSCGSFGPFTGIELVTVRKVHWLPPCERMGKAWSIENLSPPFEIQEAEISKSLPKKVLLASSTISKSAEIQDEMRSLYELPDDGELVENLELYSLSGLVGLARSFTVVLAVTNQVGPRGREQWSEHFIAASKITAEFISELWLR